MGWFIRFPKKISKGSDYGKERTDDGALARATGQHSKGRDLIAGRYEIYQVLGGEEKSGMGIVYVCYDHKFKEVCALKTFQDKYLSSKGMKDNFKKEALAWINLERHPYIVKADVVQKLNYRMFVRCEFVAPDDHGRNTLTHYLPTLTSVNQALIWSIQFCHGMEHAFARGVTPHRDIKPDNIMIAQYGMVKITDFGLAGLWEEAEVGEALKKLGEEGEKGLTFVKEVSGKTICGTPPWMAPEQFDGIADIRSDIYSFGIVLYQMATQGELPFYPKHGDSWEEAHKSYPLPLLQTQGVAISRLFPVIERCLKKSPEQRYRNFRELRGKLEEIYQGNTGEKPPSPPKIEELKAWERFNKGYSLTSLGLHDEAIKEFREVLRINPSFTRAHHNLGILFKDKDLFDEAIKEYKEALRIAPGIAEAHYNLGILLKGKGLRDEAAKEFNEALHRLILEMPRPTST